MKLSSLAALVVLPLISLATISCQTMDNEPRPEREKLSSIPHNMPESWEGQAGFPGMGGMR